MAETIAGLQAQVLTRKQEHDALLAKYDPKIVEADRLFRENEELKKEILNLENIKTDHEQQLAILQDQSQSFNQKVSVI